MGPSDRTIRYRLQDVSDDVLIMIHQNRDRFSVIHGLTAKQINHGWCREWAALAVSKLPPELDAVHMHTGRHIRDSGHSFIRIGDLYYDAESLDGVSTYWDLPLFRAIDPGILRDMMRGPDPIEIEGFRVDDHLRHTTEGDRLRAASHDMLVFMRSILDGRFIECPNEMRDGARRILDKHGLSKFNPTKLR